MTDFMYHLDIYTIESTAMFADYTNFFCGRNRQRILSFPRTLTCWIDWHRAALGTGIDSRPFQLAKLLLSLSNSIDIYAVS